ncbi:MAG TPA: nuclear transport factor 2 family protein [Acidimicrobiales bacterium]|nr:nuclear transport factor 2 family protein [Acidimicrobiales bacterium]
MTDEPVAAAELASLRRRLQVLEDKEQIRDVLVRFGYNADLGRFDDFLATLTDDCVWDVSGGLRLPEGGVSDGLVSVGHEQARRTVTGPGHLAIVNREQHLMVDFIVDVDGDDATAVGQLAVTFHGPAGFGLVTCRMCRTKLRRVDGRWLIREIVFRELGAPDCGEVIDAAGLLGPALPTAM